ncbi:ATP-binding protein [Streptomyces sp. NPDC059373]
MPTTIPAPRMCPDLAPTAQLAMGAAPEPREVRRVRQEMEKALVTWEVVHVIDDVLLVVSELVTNAVRHAPRPEIGFTATRCEGLLLIEVQDGSANPPILRHGSAGSTESGRGLGLVHSLARDWGWMPHGDGTKSTWALIAVPAADGPRTGSNHGTFDGGDKA